MSNLMDTSKVAAQVIYDSSTDRDCQFLTLEWTVQDLMGKMLTDQLATATDVYNRLEREGYTQDNPYEYNDMDNKAFILSDWKDTSRAIERGFCLIDQNHNYMFRLVYDTVFQKSQIFIYRYETQGQLNQLIFRNGTRYNDCRDEEYLAASPDTIVGHSQDCPVSRVPYIQSALMNLNTVWLDDE